MSINVTRSSMPSYEEYCEEIKGLWDSRWLTNMGAKHNELKAKLCDYLGVANVELFVNGHLALYVALKALGLSGEIITTPFTFASTTNAIVQAGCVPVYCDVKEDYTIDESKIEALITEKTVAILGVHVYGNICAVDAIDRIAAKHGLRVIYDAAHAFGVTYRDRGIGDFGDVSMFSFHATKVFHTIEGGCLTFRDGALADAIARERNFGVVGEELVCFGTNAKMNEFQAAMGLCNLRHIDDELASRKTAFDRYMARLSGHGDVTLPRFVDGIRQNYAYFPILVPDRDALAARLLEEGIAARKYFYPLVSENQGFDRELATLTPLAYEASRRVLCLPLYAHLDVADVDRICDILLEEA